MAPKTKPAAAFLTGVTGFLGAHLLHELLAQTEADIYCLVRAANLEEGKKRIQRNLESYRLWQADLSSRVIPVLGDLSEPFLGVAEPQFRLLADQIDVIYHCGAWVNFTYPYSALKKTNVLGTQEVLRLASQTRVKPVHYISSIAIFTPLGYVEDGVIFEDHDLKYSEGFFSGYAETKWVNEKIIAIARDRGIPVSVYRPGVIGGHSQTGIGNTKDLIWNIIKGCVQLGIAPDLDAIPDIDTMIDVTPVDYLSQAIVYLSQQPDVVNSTFHFANPHPLHWQEIAGVLRGFGYALRPVSDEEWQEILGTAVADSPENALYPFLPLLIQTEELLEPPAAHYATDLKLDCQNTHHGLANSAIICPPLDAKLLNTYFTHFIETGFLQAPAKV